jgi:GGDEF domain-containing protein
LIASADDAAGAVLEVDVADLQGQRMVELFHPDDRELVNRIRDRIRHGRAEECGLVVRRIDRSGRTRELTARIVAVTDERGCSGMIVFVEPRVHDVGPRPHTASETSAWRDALTGLPASTLLIDRLGHAIERTRRDGHIVGVVGLSIDDPTGLRRLHGRSGAGLVAVESADRAQRSTRPSDTIGRLSGGHLVAVLDGLDGVHVLDRIASRLEAAMAEPFTIRRADVAVAFTITTVVARPGDHPRSMLARALPATGPSAPQWTLPAPRLSTTTSPE